MDLVVAELDGLHERIASRFGRAEPCARVAEYVSGLVAGLDRKNGWTLAERAGEVSPDGMQRLLRRGGGGGGAGGAGGGGAVWLRPPACPGGCRVVERLVGCDH